MNSKSYRREQVVDIINSVLVRIKAPDELSRDSLSRELTELKGIIENLRNDLRAAKPGDITESHIPSAADELDAVVGTTEKATDAIMDSCDGILDVMKDADPALFQAVEQRIVQIFEACTFQDITGQRIRKVTDSLKLIDGKIRSILTAIEGNLVDSEDVNAKSAPAEPGLLNGPALPANAVGQDDIDKLLAAFDNPEGA